MINVLLVIHLLVTILMIGLILLQRSEGGGLGVGGGNGGMGAFAGPRSTANALSKATMFCFALFVGLSLVLAILAGQRGGSGSLIDKLSTIPAAVTAPATPAETPAASPATTAEPEAEKPAVTPPETNKIKKKSDTPVPE